VREALQHQSFFSGLLLLFSYSWVGVLYVWCCHRVLGILTWYAEVLEGKQEGSGNFHVANLAQAWTNVKALTRECVTNMERMLQQLLQVPASMCVS
jgi:hypothetical protein